MYSILISVFIFILGAIFGSFFNVVRTRGTWKVFDRSKCNNCNNNLTWKELIPIVSFLRQKGMCLKCNTHIPLHNFVIEILFGICFVLVYLFTEDIYSMIFYFIVVSFLISLSFSDAENMEIPEHMVYPLILVACTFVSLNLFFDEYHSLFFGFLLALPFFMISFFTREKGFGWGDSLVAFPLGVFADNIWDLFSIFVFAFWVGVFWVFFLFISGTKIKRRMELPFIPFLAVSFVLVVICGFSVFDVFYLPSLL